MLVLKQMKTDLSQVIAEEFGANSTYVEGLLERFRSNPELVDDSWRSYFTELIGDGNGATPVAVVTQATPAAAPAPQPKSVAPTPAPQPEGEATAIRGPALKIVENMERSLSVPTATSERRKIGR